MTERDLDQPGFDDMDGSFADDAQLLPEPTEEEVAQLAKAYPDYFPGPECLPYARFLPCIERGGFTVEEMSHVMNCRYCFRTLNGLAKKMARYVVVPPYFPQEEPATVMLAVTRSVRASTVSEEMVHGQCKLPCPPHPMHKTRVEITGCDRGLQVRVSIHEADNPFLEGLAGEKRIALLARSQIKVLATLGYEETASEGILRDASGVLGVTRDRDLLADVFLPTAPTETLLGMALVLLPGPSGSSRSVRGERRR